MMTEKKKQQIGESGKEYFRKIIIPSHLKNLQSLKLRDFRINPFLVNYLAAFLCGDMKPESFAKALVYPRILGTNTNTSFRQNIQVFISSLAQIAEAASGIDGIDIEFEDALDGRKKYCQGKVGPQTINKRYEVPNIMTHFKNLRIKVRQEHLHITEEDMIVGVFFGLVRELSDNYRIINSLFPVCCGTEFWTRITGDKRFYYRLARAFGEVVEEDDTEGKQMALGMVKNRLGEIIKYMRTHAYKKSQCA